MGQEIFIFLLSYQGAHDNLTALSPKDTNNTIKRHYATPTGWLVSVGFHQAVQSSNPGEAESSARLSDWFVPATGASGALLKFLEEEESAVMAGGCLTLETLALQNHMQMSAATVQALELVRLRTGRGVQGSKLGCLFQWLNQSRTKLGARWPLFGPPPQISFRQGVLAGAVLVLSRAAGDSQISGVLLRSWGESL